MELRQSKVFWKIYDALGKHPRYVSNRGGTRSGKTFSTLQLLHYLIPEADKAGDVTSVVSETLPHLKRGAIRDFERIVGRPLKSCQEWNASDNVWTYPNGAKLEFFSVDSPGKVQGPARKRLFVNECNHVSWATFLQLDVRTTGTVLMDYNPEATFWGIEQVETRTNCETITTTYLDNRDFLSPEQITAIEANRDNRNWWKVYGLGEIGSLEGLVYDFEQVDAIPEGSYIDILGMDFGFQADPTACVHVLADTGRKTIYAEQIIYDRHLLNSDIIARLEAAGVPKRSVPIYADCAEPKSIAEIANAGYNVHPCDKGAPTKSDKLAFQLQWMQGWKLKVTKESVDLIKELRNYTWAKDKDGNPLNYPIDQFNHALDALRYACYSHLAQREGYGQYNIRCR